MLYTPDEAVMCGGGCKTEAMRVGVPRQVPPEPVDDVHTVPEEVLRWISDDPDVTPPDPPGTPHDKSNMPEETPH